MFISKNILGSRKILRGAILGEFDRNESLKKFSEMINIKDSINTHLSDLMNSNVFRSFEMQIINKKYNDGRLNDRVARYNIGLDKSMLYSYNYDGTEIFISLDDNYEIDDIFADSESNVVDSFISNNWIYFTFVIHSYEDCRKICANMISPILRTFNYDLEFIKTNLMSIVLTVPFDTIQYSILISDDINTNNIENIVIDHDDIDDRYTYKENDMTLSILRNALRDAIILYIKENDNGN